MYSVMWSEHCSYKSSKVHLRRFGETTTEAMRARLLAGIGENAGVVDVGDGWAVTFKIESHNHPSYVEPHQGAATGVGGIVRDIMAMGARPVAVMDGLRVGPLDAPDTARVLPGVVSGVGFYGNCLGLPNIGGEVVFDPSYVGQPAGQRPVRRRAAPRGPAPGVRVRRRQQDRALRGPHGPRRHRRGLGAGVGDLHRSDGHRAQEAAQRAGRRPVRREGPHRVLPRALRRRAGRRHPGPRRRRAVLRDERARERRRRRHARRPRHRPAARREHDRRRDPLQRVAGADVRGGHPGERRRLHGGLPALGRHGDGDRRGHRRRPPADHAPGRDGGRRPAAHRRPRRPGLRAALRPPRLAGRAAGGPRRRAGAAVGTRRAGRPDPRARRVAGARRADVGHRAVRPLRPRQHHVRDARRRRRASAWTRPAGAGSRCRSTPTPASASSTRAPGPSSPSPSRCATWRPRARSRSRSPTA